MEACVYAPEEGACLWVLSVTCLVHAPYVLLPTATCYFGNQEKWPFRSSFNGFSFYKRGSSGVTTLSGTVPCPLPPPSIPHLMHPDSLSPFTQSSVWHLPPSDCEFQQERGGVMHCVPTRADPSPGLHPTGSPPSTSSTAWAHMGLQWIFLEQINEL